MSGCPCDRCRSTPPRMAPCSYCYLDDDDDDVPCPWCGYVAPHIIHIWADEIEGQSLHHDTYDLGPMFIEANDAKAATKIAADGYPSVTNDDKIAGAVPTGRPDRSGRAPGTGRDESPDSDEPVTAPACYPSVTDEP